MKTIINEQYSNKLVIESLNITFYIILLYFIKIHNHDQNIKLSIWFNQHISKRLLTCDQRNYFFNTTPQE